VGEASDAGGVDFCGDDEGCSVGAEVEEELGLSVYQAVEEWYGMEWMDLPVRLRNMRICRRYSAWCILQLE
jgi:hypothetical protein